MSQSDPFWAIVVANQSLPPIWVTVTGARTAARKLTLRFIAFRLVLGATFAQVRDLEVTVMSCCEGIDARALVVTARNVQSVDHLHLPRGVLKNNAD